MNALVSKKSYAATVDTLQRHLAGPVKVLGEYDYKEPVPRVVCANDVSVSVQASRTSYSRPRANFGPWTHVELGYPSVRPPEFIMRYAEEPDNPTGTVYGQVPIELVAAWIESCGGMVPALANPTMPATWEVIDTVDNKGEDE